MTRNILWSSILATSFLFCACQDRDVDKAGNAVKKTSESVSDDLRSGGRQTKHETMDLEKSMNEKMTKLDAKIVKLDAKGDQKSREMAAEFRARRDELKRKVQQLGESTDDSADSMKVAITSAWDRLEADVDAAL